MISYFRVNENTIITNPGNKKKYRKCDTFLMPAAGLEPARGCPQQILSLPRLPFRHTGRFLNRFVSYHSFMINASFFFIKPSFSHILFFKQLNDKIFLSKTSFKILYYILSCPKIHFTKIFTRKRCCMWCQHCPFT